MREGVRAGFEPTIAAIAFTERGCRLAMRLAGELEGKTSVSGPERFAGKLGIAAYDSLGSWTAGAFSRFEALVFVGAAGIAVRAIAAHVRDKFSDPAVVSVDEFGRVAVPLLSGHVGGANDLAREVARVTGGIAAVSTATDLNGRFAVDEFARDHGFALAERELAREISAALLEGRAVSFGEGLGAVVTPDLSSRPFERTLHLVPRMAVVGVGCRRGTSLDVLSDAVARALARAGVARESVGVLATVDVKADELAVLTLAARNGWKLKAYSADELTRVRGDFSSSEFVRQTVGVDNVCERAACAGGGDLVLKKQSGEGVTVAVAVEGGWSR